MQKHNISFVKVGVGALLIKNGKVLLGKRLSKIGNNMFSPPGGLVDFWEEPFDAIVREVTEECNLSIRTAHKGPWFSNIHQDQGALDHSISLFYLVTDFSGKLTTKEPDKCESWNWYELNKLPTPLFAPMQSFIHEYPHFTDGNFSMFARESISNHISQCN